MEDIHIWVEVDRHNRHNRHYHHNCRIECCYIVACDYIATVLANDSYQSTPFGLLKLLP